MGMTKVDEVLFCDRCWTQFIKERVESPQHIALTRRKPKVGISLVFESLTGGDQRRGHRNPFP